VSFSQSHCEATRCISGAQLRSLNSALRDARDRHVSGESVWDEDTKNATGTGQRLSAGGGLSVRYARPGFQDGLAGTAPLWAGIAALADQDAHRQLGFLNTGLYRIGHSPQYHRAFHDITNGNNTVTLPSGKNVVGYRARPGWDAASGLGSPNAQVLVPLLGTEVHPGDGQRL
jgi:hypothetical protein